MQVDETEDQVILTTFQTGLLPGDFFFSITKSPPKTVTQLLRKAQRYMTVENAMLVKEMKGKRKRDERISSNRKVLGRPQGKRSFQTGNPSSPTSLL